MWREQGIRTEVNPLRELFDATARGYAIKLTCRGCRRTRTFPAAAVWWHFRCRGFSERLRDVPGKFCCQSCDCRAPDMDVVHETPNDASLPMPAELVWKQELRRRR